MISKKKRIKPQPSVIWDHLPSIQSLFLVICSIVISFVLWQSGWLYSFIHGLGSLEYLGVFLAGIGFVSIFTAAPSAVVLIVLSQDISPSVVATIAGIGSMVGDLILLSIFSKIMPRQTQKIDDTQRILRIISHLRHTKYRMLLSVVGVVIIASPLPDELGLAMMGLGKTPWGIVAVLTFAMNALGIYVLLLAS
jgi:hypothetical protein